MAKLGTLTVDLVARVGGFVSGMDKADRESAKRIKNIRKNMEVLGQATGIAVTAATTALTGLTVATVKSAKDIQRFSAISQTTARDFQRFADGANRVGIENEKLADIFKDVNDRVGDFLITGAGPLADFFEVIAPKVGVTADQFRGLSGPQALGLFVKTLEGAGVSAAEFTFFLESLSGDAAALLPLLLDNGRLLREFGDAAEDAGTILSDDLIASSLAFDAILKDTKKQLKGIGIATANDLLPALVGIASAFQVASIEFDKFQTEGDLITKTLKLLAQGAATVGGGFELAGRSIGAFFAVLASIPRQDGDSFLNTEAFGRVSEVLKSLGQDVEDIQTRYSVLLGDIADVPSSGNGVEKLGDDAQTAGERLAELQNTIRETLGGGVGVGSSEGTGITALIKDLELQVFELENGADALAAYKLELAGATPEQQAYAASLRATVSELEGNKEALEQLEKAADDATVAERRRIDETFANANRERERINAQVEQIRESLLTEEESIRESYARRRQIILDNTKITGEAQNNLLKRLEEDTNQQLLEINGTFWQKYLVQAEEALTNLDEIAATTITNFASDFSNVIEGIIFDADSLDEALFSLFDGFARAGVNALAELAAQWLVYQAVQLAGVKTAQAAAATTIGANAIAQQQLAALNAFASTAAIPITGPALAPAAAAAALAATSPFVAAATSAALAGVAHDGLMSVPQTGTYLLEKGERVTTADTSAKLDKKLDGMGSGGGIRIINAWDTSMIGDYIGSSSGEQIVMNTIKKNQRTIKALASA